MNTQNSMRYDQMPQSIFIAKCPECKHEFPTKKCKCQCGKCGTRFEVKEK